MPVKLIIQKEVVLSDSWIDKESWEDMIAGKSELSFLDILNEDVYEVIKECGGLEGIIKSMEWVE